MENLGNENVKKLKKLKKIYFIDQKESFSNV